MNPFKPFFAYLQGYKLAYSRPTIAWSILPLLLIFLIQATLFYLARDLIDSALEYLDNWPTWLLSILSFSFNILAFLGIALFTLILATTLTLPFLELIARSVLQRLKTSPTKSKGQKDGMSNREISYSDLNFWAGMRREWQKLKYMLPLMLIGFVLLFVPGLNLVSLVLFSWLAAFEYLDFAALVKGEPLTSTRIYMRKNAIVALIFGLVTVTLVAIPVVGATAMVAATAASVWLRKVN